MRNAMRQVWRRSTTAVAAALLLVAVWGCGEDARLADQELPHVEVRTVHDQGLELGPDAAPQDVVFVLLRAIRDDIKAGGDLKARRAALERQFDVSAPDFMHDLYREAYGSRAVASRDEWVFKKVNLWAPTLGYYVDAFDFDVETARALMSVGKTGQHNRWPGESVSVDVPVPDPSGQPGAGVVIRVWLHQTDGGYWRVVQVGFTRERPAAPETSQPAPPLSPSSPAADET